MGDHTLSGLGEQQLNLTRREYDVRITNLLRFIYKKMINKEGSLIDIGAGNGLALQFFKNRGFRVKGVELSKKLCEEMKKNPLLKGIKIQHGNIIETTGKDTFDYVLACAVI